MVVGPHLGIEKKRRRNVTGTIKKLNFEKRYGFIRGEDGIEYFFHRSEVAPGISFESLEEGERMFFEPTESTKGPRAEGVERA